MVADKVLGERGAAAPSCANHLSPQRRGESVERNPDQQKWHRDGVYAFFPVNHRLLMSTVPCTRLVITSGAWSPRVFSALFPKSTTRIPISSLAGHSLLVRNHHHNPEQLESEICHALFATDDLGFSPELFSRVGGELYLAGLNSTTIPLPEQTSDVKIDPKAIEQMKKCAAGMIGAVDGKDMEVLREALVSS